ncbi:MAG TPA: type I restriction-modification enzyme R subunit C-terminal domain-containing protein [Herpetosiphonaceae bacterium]
MDDRDHTRIEQLTDGIPLTQIVNSLLDAIDADTVEATALVLAGLPSGSDPGDTKRQQAQTQLVSAAANVFTGELVKLLDSIRRDKEQTLDHDNLDRVLRAEWDKAAITNAEALTDKFADYLKAHQDTIAALTIFFSQPYRRRELSFAMLSEVLQKLKADQPKLAPLWVWQAYRQLDNYQGSQPITELTALVGLIRRVCGMDETVANFEDTVRRNFQNWIMKHHSGGGGRPADT